MKVGLIGLGRMGEGMSRRMKSRGQIEVWGYRRNYEKAQEAYENGYVDGVTTTIESLVQVVKSKKNGGIAPGIFMMVVPAENVEETINELLRYCSEGDIIINYGHSHSENSWETEQRCSKFGIPYINCTVSSDIHDMGNGYGFMVIGGDTAVTTCKRIFDALAPGIDTAPRTAPGSYLTNAELGWLHCGGPGAGHFVKMVHNGIEYGIMQAYAEGFNILHNANLGKQYTAEGDAEVAPMADPESYCYDIDVPEVAELWRRGSVIGSWLLDLTADVLRHNRNLDNFDGGVSDSGEGRWTVNAAVDLGVPAPVISSALYERFNSRNLGSFSSKILNGMRFMFGGHNVR